MNDLAFADATRPTRCVILKLPMMEYSIGHEILLLQQRNPLLMLAREDFEKLPVHEQCAAVIRAVLVCCQTWEQNKKPHRWLWLWNRRNRRANFPLAIAEFRNYRAAGSTLPELITKTHPMHKDEGGRDLGSPLLACLLQWARLDFDCPLGFAHFMYFTTTEIEGGCKVENAFEFQTRIGIQKHLDDIKREQKEKEKQCPA